MIVGNKDKNGGAPVSEARPKPSKKILKNKNASQKDLIQKQKHEIWLAS